MKPILNLNKHPKDCDNLSMVNAINVKLSNDGSCLQSENSIDNHKTIINYIKGFYGDSDYEIISLLPCNKELLIFAKRLNSNDFCDVFRYNEIKDSIKVSIVGLNYYGGEIKGAFTYNVNDELIISITEINTDKEVPLRTINLGKFDVIKEQLINDLFPINPEVTIPTLQNYDYVSGSLPKGWYYIFVRYKIDNNDYTSWFDIGGPILIADVEKQSIFKYYGYKTVGSSNKSYEPYSIGALDHFNSLSDNAEETLELNLKYLDDRYKKYQISFICVNKTNIVCYKSFDINKSINNYILNINTMEEYSYEDVLINNANVYNVQNLINYQNRLYISNYKEKNLLNYDTSNIKLNLISDTKEYLDIKHITYKHSDNSSETYLDTDDEVDYINFDKFNDDTAQAKIVPNLLINGKAYNTIFENTVNNYISLHNPSQGQFIINLYGEKGLKPQVSTDIEDGVEVYVIKELCKILTFKGNLLDVEFYARIKYATVAGDCYFKYTIDNKTYLTTCTYTLFDYQNGIITGHINPYNAQITDDILLPSVDEIEYSNSSYINVKHSFNDRRKNTTLIPGEVYNFYIHFVDKYGFSTKGFKINPNNKLSGVPVIINYVDGENTYKYALMKPNTNIFNEAGVIQITRDNCIGIGNYFINRTYDDYFDIYGYCSTDYEGLSNALISLYGEIDKSKKIKWEDVSVGNLETAVINSEEDLKTFMSSPINYPKQFVTVQIPYYNKNNELLFKIPYANIENIKTNNGEGYRFPNIKFNVENVTIPDTYIGYFISYEKFEEISKCTGLLTKYDFNDIIHDENDTLTHHNLNKSSKMYFYSSDFDILDSVNLSYNTLRIEKKNTYKASDNPNVVVNSIISNICNLNVIETEEIEPLVIRYFPITDYNICAGGDVTKNRFGLGTCLELPIIDELFNEDDINLYKVSLLYINNNNYTSEDKKLIKCTNTIYPDIYEESIPVQYLNGKNTYNGTIIYDNNKFIYNDATFNVEAEKGKKYINFEDEKNVTAKFLTYFQIPCYRDFFYETKSFKQTSEKIYFKLAEITSDSKADEVPVELGCIIRPQYSISLFENKYDSIEEFTPKSYQNNRTDIIYLSDFNKFIRRSNVIQDESLNNAWRNFELENYKVISENKGNITNIVGIGSYFIVHTEHSMFLFDKSNTLKTADKDIQLSMPDIFDIDYKEIVTSDLGYCGLQDSKACITDQFGYIFYDNDAHRLYRFDAGAINTIDDNILQFLIKYKPNKIRFANDKESDRLLISIHFGDIKSDNNIVLSYNYKINSFISTHNYNFKDAVNTKNILYLIGTNNKSIYTINYDNIENVSYNIFANGTNKVTSSQIDIIVNESYDIVKTLEYIVYKLYKIKQNTTENYVGSPVEEIKSPYSGERIRVYNNEVDTGWLNIKIDSEESKNIFSNYTKPVWDLGNWNFSYLRNNSNLNISSDLKTRLYGNYFIISIKFGDTNERVEFESLGYSINKDRRI